MERFQCLMANRWRSSHSVCQLRCQNDLSWHCKREAHHFLYAAIKCHYSGGPVQPHSNQPLLQRSCGTTWVTLLVMASNSASLDHHLSHDVWWKRLSLERGGEGFLAHGTFVNSFLHSFSSTLLWCWNSAWMKSRKTNWNETSSVCKLNMSDQMERAGSECGRAVGELNPTIEMTLTLKHHISLISEEIYNNCTSVVNGKTSMIMSENGNERPTVRSYNQRSKFLLYFCQIPPVPVELRLKWMKILELLLSFYSK